MLVLAPTRELAMQSHVVIEEFGALVNLKCLVVYGGVPKYQQTNELKKGVDCVVATPGRIKDLINEGACDLSRVSQLILDEADRMLGTFNMEYETTGSDHCILFKNRLFNYTEIVISDRHGI